MVNEWVICYRERQSDCLVTRVDPIVTWDDFVIERTLGYVELLRWIVSRLVPLYLVQRPFGT